MTAKQKQLILCCFDLIPLEDIDGIWGEQSEAATKQLQHGLGIKEDGDFGNDTRDAAFARLASGEPLQDVADNNVGDILPPTDFWEEIEFFSPDEMECKCGGKYCDGYPHEIQPLLMQILDRARRWSGRPISVISGLRCPEWNRIQKGHAQSQHQYGEAADLYFYGVAPNAALAWAQSQPDVRYAYRIEGSNNIHLDIQPVGR